MIKTETQLYEALKKVPGFWFTRIESGSKATGIPDVYYLCQQEKLTHQGWIELKIGKRLKGMVRVEYRPGQISWLKRHSDRDLKAFCLICFGYDYILTQNYKTIISIDDLYNTAVAWSVNNIFIIRRFL